MEIVYKIGKKWYQAVVFITEKIITLNKEKQIKSVKDVENIDDYIHIEKYVKINQMNTHILKFMKKNNIDDMYIKYVSPRKRLCSFCKKKCKNEKVLWCNMFDADKRRTKMWITQK